jgi:PTS system nitrogen regulatory IIA component
MTESDSEGFMSIKRLSEYLTVSEKTIYRMLEKNSLPAIRIGGQWRFRKRDIDEWIDNQVKKADLGDRQVLADLGPSEIAMTPLLEPDNIWLNVPASSKEEVLKWMVTQAKLEEGIDRSALTESILQREKMCSTALVSRAAFPHLDDPGKFKFSRKRVLLAILQQPLSWEDPHGHQPQVVAMILARRVQGYLLTISRAIKLFSNPDFIDALIQCNSRDGVIAFIRQAEDRL